MKLFFRRRVMAVSGKMLPEVGERLAHVVFDRGLADAEFQTNLTMGFPTSRTRSCAATRITEARLRAARMAASASDNLARAGDWLVRGVSSFLVDPDRSAAESPAIWTAERNPSVIRLVAEPNGDQHGPLRDRRVQVERRTSTGHHLVVTEDGYRHRVSVTPPAVDLPAGYFVPLAGPITVRLAALAAFHGDWRTSAALRPTLYHRARLDLLLAILDRLGSSHDDRPTVRQIAEDLIYPGVKSERAIDWKTSSHRRHAQRLIVAAISMRDVGFWSLLYRSPRR